MPKPNYRALNQFYIAATEGTLSSAADRLGVSQSALSQQIAKLEADLGKKLFHRNGRTLSLSPIGRKLLSQVSNSFDKIDIAWSETRLQANAQDSLMVASVHTLFTYFLPDILENYLEAIPSALPDIRGHSSADVIIAALGRAVDIGLVYDTELVHENLEKKVIFQENIVAIFNPDVPWANDLRHNQTISKDVPLIVFQKGHALRSMLDRSMRKNSPQIRVETDNVELMLRLTQAKIGCALLPVGVAQQYCSDRNLEYCNLDNPILKRNVIAVWRQDEALRPLAKTFLEFCQMQALNLKT